MTRSAGGLVDVGDVGSSAGWQTVSLAAGIANTSGFALSVLGLLVAGVQLVYVRGRVTGLVAATNTVLNDVALPAALCPGLASWELGTQRNAGTTKASVWVDSSGFLNARTDSGTAAFVFGSWVGVGP